MGEFQAISAASDRVMAALVSGLEIEFGQGAGAALAQRFLEAEEVDLCWDARVEERWIGVYSGAIEAGEEDLELDQIAVLGRLDGRWFAARMIVDGDGLAQGLMAKRTFARRQAAEAAFARL